MYCWSVLELYTLQENKDFSQTFVAKQLFIAQTTYADYITGVSNKKQIFP